MTQAIHIITRNNLDATAWDSCVQASSRRIVYGYCWYLDSVLPAPDWQWVGLVQLDNSGQYRAVMPVPLRRKNVAELYQKWVVHQPFFCHFLGLFSRDETVDVQPFFDVLIRHFHYGSIYATNILPVVANRLDDCQIQTTHILDLAVGYAILHENYTQDRKVNLRRAMRASWTVAGSTDVDPLLMLFREHHAPAIKGGVADWAYAIFRKLFAELSQRNLVVLRYALRANRIEAGVLFIQEGNRIIYLFNAASPMGRHSNARTLLIDKIIQEKAGQPVLFDFESPAKPSIRSFYESFGAVEKPFYTVRWNQLNRVERTLLWMKKTLYR